MQACVTLIIHGKVQGVGFRASTKAFAQEMNLTGYVQNMPDGTVKAVAEAEKKNLEKFVAWIKAREIFGKKIVAHVDINYEEAKGEFKDFEIRR